MYCVFGTAKFVVGDPPPSGYLDKHEWARVQLKGGLSQRPCPNCGRWRFPQEKCDCEREVK